MTAQWLYSNIHIYARTEAKSSDNRSLDNRDFIVYTVYLVQRSAAPGARECRRKDSVQHVTGTRGSSEMQQAMMFELTHNLE